MYLPFINFFWCKTWKMPSVRLCDCMCIYGLSIIHSMFFTWFRWIGCKMKDIMEECDCLCQSVRFFISIALTTRLISKLETSRYRMIPIFLARWIFWMMIILETKHWGFSEPFKPFIDTSACYWVLKLQNQFIWHHN